jgi:hypothetical protein
MDPQRDVLDRILAREGEQLGGEHHSVVVVEHAVEDQYSLTEEPFSKPMVEQRLVVVGHAPTMTPLRCRSPVSLL